MTFAIPLDSGVNTLQTVGGAVDDGEGTLDNFEVIDEKTSLLKAEGGSVQKPAGPVHRSGSLRRVSVPSAAQSPLPVASSPLPPPAAVAGGGGGVGVAVPSGPIMDTGTESVDSRLPKVGVVSGRGGEKSHSMYLFISIVSCLNLLNAEKYNDLTDAVIWCEHSCRLLYFL